VVYSLRLAYLRRVDDACGPRIITFPDSRGTGGKHSPSAFVTAQGRQSFHQAATFASSHPFGGAVHDPSTHEQAKHRRRERDPLGGEAAGDALLGDDSHVVIGGLNDPGYFPEIDAAYSPEITAPLSDFASRDEAGPSTGKRRPNGLGYTQTIYGPERSAVLGMRVSGKRESGNTRNSIRSRHQINQPVDIIEESTDAQDEREAELDSPEPPTVKVPENERTEATQTGWRAARQERLRKMAATAAAEQAAATGRAADAVSSAKDDQITQISEDLRSSSRATYESPPPVEKPARPARRPFLDNSDSQVPKSASSSSISLLRPSRRPGSGSSNSIPSSGGASVSLGTGSSSPDVGGQRGPPLLSSSGEHTRVAESTGTRSRSASEGASTMPASIGCSQPGFGSLEEVDSSILNHSQNFRVSHQRGEGPRLTSEGESDAETR
jgi:hypothetical protein